MTRPSADGSLPFKQTVLGVWTAKIGHAHGQLQALVAAHNKRYNPSGQTFKQGSVPGNKRTAAEALNDPDAGASAQEFPRMRCLTQDD